MDTKEQQFTEIIRMYERTIYTVCHMFSDNTDEVNDLYQEILVRLWKGFDAFKGKSDIKTWIYRVSLNYCINFHNKQKKEQERLTLGIDLHTSSNLEKNLQIGYNNNICDTKGYEQSEYSVRCPPESGRLVRMPRADPLKVRL